VKLPAVAITAAFACGVALGPCPPLVRLAISPFWLAAGFLAATFLIVVGIRLANAGVRVLRTDRDGAVHILLDGKGVEVTYFVPCLPVGGNDLRRAQAPDQKKNEEQQ
jgi:hypothetical protein